MIPIAQMKPENRAPPRMSAMPPSGAGFGKASEIVSVKPFRKNSMPSVVMNDGTPVATVMMPFRRPTKPAPSRAITTATGRGSPASVQKYMRNGVIA